MKTPRLKAKKIDRRVLREAMVTFRPALEGQRPAFLAAIIITLVFIGLELLRPWPIQYVLDNVVLNDGWPTGWSRENRLGLACGAIVAISLAIGTTNLWRTVLVATVGRRAATRIRRDLFRHLHRLSFPFHQSQRTGDLLIRLMGDVNMVRDLLFGSWISVLTQGLMFVGVFTILCTLSPSLALLSIAPLPLILMGVRRSNNKLRVVTTKQRKKEGQAASMAAESLSQILLVKSHANEDGLARLFGRQARSGERAGARAAEIAAAAGRWVELFTGLGLALVVFAGSRAVLAGDLTAGRLVVAVTYVRALYKPLRGLSREAARVAKATACAARVLEILRTEPEVGDAGEPAPGFRGDVVFDDVRFTFEDGTPALRGASFHIRAGQLALLRGENGSGKSTSLNLILRLLRPDPQGGSIRVDSEPIERWSLDTYRKRFAFVPQQIQLFAGTLRDNILYGEPEADEAAVLRAVAMAQLTEFMESLPRGLDTLIGEGGASLSGGEARRVMLARAAVRNADILLLDEPLTGLDPEARSEVAGSIRSLAAGRTTIVVSHGSAEEVNPDQIIVLADGTVQEAASAWK